jgi:pentatricopeptide repeat protein
VAAINSLISSCGRGGRADISLALINDMESKFGVKPDERSYRSAMIACNQAQHEQVLYQEAEEVDEDLGDVKWWECALSLLRRMKESKLSPDVQTISSVISACESAGQWQRALGTLQAYIDTNPEGLNTYCFNAAISACEKGDAWVEALDLYERMIDLGGKCFPNLITVNSLVVALDKAGQEELAQSKYEEARKMKIVNPWRKTFNDMGREIEAIVSASTVPHTIYFHRIFCLLVWNPSSVDVMNRICIRTRGPLPRQLSAMCLTRMQQDRRKLLKRVWLLSQEKVLEDPRVLYLRKRCLSYCLNATARKLKLMPRTAVESLCLRDS